VTYQQALGSVWDKTVRVAELARVIANRVGVDAALATRAANLAKCDLLTRMVGEFPELQGVMGRYYATASGEHADVAQALDEFYAPRFAGDAIAKGKVGQVLAVAERLDTLAGIFAVGMKPSGNKDPFALRRHALGVIRILTEKNLPLELPALLQGALPAFGALITDPAEALRDFFADRLAVSLRDQGYSAQEVDAVLALAPTRLGDLPRRLDAVRAFAALPEAASLAAANKRVGNILKKIDGVVPTTVDGALLREPAEQALAQALATVRPQADSLFAQHDYTASLQALAALRVPVDAFFESVMVNAEDAALRANRLGLLAQLHAAMNRVADLSKLAT